MTLAPVWRTRVFAVGASGLAVWFGVYIAHQQYLWPALVAGGLLLFALATWQPLPLATVLLGAIVFGYLVGNRGFAQIMLLPDQPLLPAEAVLLLAGSLMLVQAAWRHALPVRADPLNVLLLAWITLGCIRVAFDYRLHGFLALRDFAVVYYAAFFFLAQEAARDVPGQRFLSRVILAGCAALLITSFLYERFPDFFFNILTLRGAPLIYYKGDLIGTFLAVGSVQFFLRFEAGRGRWNLALSLVMTTAVIATNNRASMMGLLVATLWLLAAGRWRFAATQAITGAVAAVVILVAASSLNIAMEKTPLFGLYERIVSLTDPTGQRAYRGESTFNKGDNNLFRTVWWQAVLTETVEGNPYVGLGFGHDLADRFVREYYPESGEEFSVRSPHNVLVTVFARMGAAGLSVLLAILGVVAVRTWRAVKAGPEAAAAWCGAWVIGTSACFGVVLEGPMGAVVFWTTLGLAHATSTSTSPRAVANSAV